MSWKEHRTTNWIYISWDYNKQQLFVTSGI